MRESYLTMIISRGSEKNVECMSLLGTPSAFLQGPLNDDRSGYLQHATFLMGYPARSQARAVKNDPRHVLSVIMRRI